MLCIGHRGAGGHAPENTLKSVARALELGADWVEIDVHYVDNHLIVIHDETLDRTTNGKGYLQDKSFSYIRTLDAGEGEKVPTLEEVLDLTRGKAGVNIELKGPGTVRPVIELLRKSINKEWGTENFLISSFNQPMLFEARKMDNSVLIGVLLENSAVNYSAIIKELAPYSVNQNLYYVNSRFVKDAHNRGLKVFVYTVNRIYEIKRMKDMGVDGIFTDYPERLLSIK